MEHHKCKLFKKDKLYDDNAECWFERRDLGYIEITGEITCSKDIFHDIILGEGEYLMILQDGRKGNILITNVNSADPRSGRFELSGPLE